MFPDAPVSRYFPMGFWCNCLRILVVSCTDTCVASCPLILRRFLFLLQVPVTDDVASIHTPSLTPSGSTPVSWQVKIVLYFFCKPHKLCLFTPVMLLYLHSLDYFFNPHRCRPPHPLDRLKTPLRTSLAFLPHLRWVSIICSLLFPFITPRSIFFIYWCIMTGAFMYCCVAL